MPVGRNRLEKLRRLMREERIGALLLTDPVNVGYITGFTGGDSFALVTPKSQCILTDARYTEQAEKQAPAFAIVTRKGEMTETVQMMVKKYRVRDLAFEAAALSYELFSAYKKVLRGVRLKPEKPLVQKLRIIKEPDEVRKIQRAIDVAEKAMKSVRRMMRPGMTEKEIAAELEYRMRLLGAQQASFQSIVASGKNSSMPHAQCSDRRLKTGDAVTIDWGAQFEFYSSDLTRVFFIGRIAPRFRKIYEIVYAAQKAAIEAVRPGMQAQQLDRVAREYIKSKGYGDKFGHSLGHGLGLGMHEAPRLGQKVTVPLEAGMVCTIEPGIYIPGFGGVRLEDDVLITERGCKVLSTFPKDIERMII